MRSRLCFLLAALLAPALFADTITLKNGDRITGKIEKTDANAVVVKTDYAGEIKIDLAAVATLTSDAPLNVTLKSGKQSRGKVSFAGDMVNVEGGPQAKRADLAAMRDDDNQKAWEREDERQHHPKLLDFWAGSAAFGLAEASGNSNQTTLNTSAAVARVAGKNKMSLYFNQVYATQSTTLPYGETANRVGGGFRVDRDVSSRMFAFGTTDYDYDKFLGLDLRSVFGGGFGYHAWKSSKGHLDFGGGAVYDHEKYSTGLNRNSAEVLGTEEFGAKMLSRLNLIERLQLYPNMSDTGQFRLNFDTTASVPIYKFLELNFGVNDRYQTDPLPGHKGNDILFTTGVRFSFDQTKRK
jgi:putative salt-induced outer membrane protein YdiY